ncbi:hypothetical protein N7490_008451 [Penicillium lividum]|nr:hypothetical protein N7490_008451 [Penicillium lividum]
MLFSTTLYFSVAIYGLHGVSKTQIALELAHRTHSKHEEYAVYLIQAMNIESVQKAYIQIAGQLKLPGTDDQNADLSTLLKDYLNKRARKWLLIFDNADDFHVFRNANNF